MENHPIPASGIGTIFAKLAAGSARPRYAFLVLQLIAEAANGQGRAGPTIVRGDAAVLLRDWLCAQLQPMSERDDRRGALRARVAAGLQGQLTGEADHDEALLRNAVNDHVLLVGRANVSRAVSDLVRAGLVRRHYAGYATNHVNRGAGRHAVYVVEPDVLSALGKPGAMIAANEYQPLVHGQLFAA
ncbi:MAG: hypothetical protein RL367_219 [Pseudomonadota bacterium]